MNKVKNIFIRIKSNILIRIEAYKKIQLPKKDDNLIVILDTAINTDNLGDQIIMHFANQILAPILSSYKVIRVATHIYPTSDEILLMQKAKFVIICGTNILSPQMELYSGWKFVKELIHLDNVILMAVGWWGYKTPSIYSKFIYKKILSRKCLHSTRDMQTEKLLKGIGITNVINTNCLTLWDIDKNCTNISSEKKNVVLFTVTGVYKDVKNDKILISILKRNYSKIVFWPQGTEDYQYYLDNLFDETIEVLDKSLEAITEFLCNTDTDYIGSRLHGGIYALHFHKRVIIIAVDNRAIEIGRDTNLPIIKMNDISEELEKMITSSRNAKLTLNTENKNKWINSLVEGLRSEK